MNRMFKLAVIVAASSATPAFAQDDAKSGVYLQIRAGIADLNNPDFIVTNTDEDPDERLVTKLNTRSSATFGGEIGYDFGEVRVGLELAYQRNK